MAYVYQHIRLDTDTVFYIGIGSDTDGKFNRANLIKGRKNPHWNNVVNKVGHRVEILTDGISWKEACKEEKRLIKLYGRIADGGILTNITEGGDGVWGMTQDMDLLDRLSKINKGAGNPMFGKTHTIESREKMAVNRGRKFHISVEEKERIRAVKKTNKEIKQLKASLLQTPNIEVWAELYQKQEYLNTIKKPRMKRYERVKAKRNLYEAGHTR
jgi:hypothetical protein